MELKLPLIHDKRRFKEAMKLGTQFWTFEVNCGEPIGISGPYVFSRIEIVPDCGMYHETWEKVICSHPDYAFVDHYWLNDLLNSSHGVWLSEKDAQEGFAAAREMYLHNPEMQKRVKADREFYDMMDDFLMDELEDLD